MQQHPELRKEKHSSSENAVNLSSPQDAVRTGSRPAPEWKTTVGILARTNSSPLGCREVAAALKEPVSTPGVMADW